MAPRFGTWKPLPEADDQALIVPTIAVVHSIVGSARGAYNYFRDSTNIESHWITTKAGEAWQCMESDRRADANYKVNRFSDGTRYCGALSMETEDNGDPDRDPWTDAQMETIIEWFRWCNREFGIPLRVCATPFAPGIGYHSLHPMIWTNVRGKTCPGAVRINQFNHEIMPELLGVKPAPAPVQEDDIMKSNLAWFREKAGSDAVVHCYKFNDAGIATWMPTQKHIDVQLFFGVQMVPPIDPVLWQTCAVVNGPLKNI